MAKKKSKIKEVVETMESWVGMGPKAKKKAATKKPAPAAPQKTTKKKAKKKAATSSPAPKTVKKKKKKAAKKKS